RQSRGWWRGWGRGGYRLVPRRLGVSRSVRARRSRRHVRRRPHAVLHGQHLDVGARRPHAGLRADLPQIARNRRRLDLSLSGPGAGRVRFGFRGSRAAARGHRRVECPCTRARDGLSRAADGARVSRSLRTRTARLAARVARRDLSWFAWCPAGNWLAGPVYLIRRVITNLAANAEWSRLVLQESRATHLADDQPREGVPDLGAANHLARNLHPDHK